MTIVNHFYKARSKYAGLFLFSIPVILFILLPIIAVLIESFRIGDSFTLRRYEEFFIRPYYNRALINSLLLSTLTSTIVVILGAVIAIFTTKTTSILRLPIKTLALLPLIAPPYIFSLSLIVLLGRRGILSNLLGVELNIYGWIGIIIAQVTAFLPLAYMMIENVLISTNPNLEEAAYDLGAKPHRVLLTITLPLATPGFLKAFLLVFIWAIADFANPALIGGGVSLLATDAYLLIVGENNTAMASVLCIFLVLPSIGVFMVHKYMFKGRSYTTILGKPQASEPRRMATYLLVPILAISAGICLFILINLFIIVASASVKALMFDNRFTFENFLGRDSLASLQNSFKMAMLAAFLGSILSILLSYVISRRHFPFTNILEFASLLGFCVPGTVMGIGYVLFFNKVSFLVGSVLLLSLSTAFRNLAIGIEAGTGKLQQIDVSLEEASCDLGAGKISTFLRVVLPLMKSSYFASFLFIFMEGMITVSAVIFLISPGKNLASLKILELVETGFIGQACGISVLLIIVVGICLIVTNLLTRKTYEL
jgi:iron(III) transport system permease protein